jgi:hypothetical protein
VRRRAVLTGALGLAGLGAAGTAAVSLRWHSSPRREPYLTQAHLEGLRDLAAAPARVLFVGNSFTLMHDIPGQVARAAATETVPVQIAMAAANGARLVESWRIGALRAVLRDGWDVLVLQDFSATVLRAPDRWGASHAMRAMAREAAAGAVLIYPNWALPAGHPVYRGAGGFLAATPADRDDFAARITVFYEGLAAREGWHRAPVTEALHDDIARFTAADGHHLNAQGSARVSAVLWKSLRGLLP